MMIFLLYYIILYYYIFYYILINAIFIAGIEDEIRRVFVKYIKAKARKLKSVKVDLYTILVGKMN